MDTKKFTIVLRKIIREEVTKAVRTELRQMLTEDKTSHKSVIEHGVQLHDMVEQRPIKKSVKKKKKYSDNPMLNDLLNDTTTLKENSDWSTMNFKSEMAQAFGTNPNEPVVAPMTDLQGKPLNTNNEQVAATVNAMTRDYSALMKAIDKKQGK
jgi:DNA gyrase/topoisomerase IV subunit B